MPWASDHTKWLVDTGERLKAADGKVLKNWEVRRWAPRAREKYWRAEYEY